MGVGNIKQVRVFIVPKKRDLILPILHPLKKILSDEAIKPI